MIIEEDTYLAHYGILRKSGRYPWGSGASQNTRNKTFLDMVADLKGKGLTEKEIVKGLGLDTTTQLRALKSIALNEQKQSNINMAQRLKDKGYSNVAIGERMGINESSVRSLLAPGAKEKADILQSTANMLKSQVAEKGYLDVGVGTEYSIGVSADKLATAVAMLREEGYGYHYIKVPQVNNPGQFTTMKVLSKPGVHTRDVYANRDNIKQITDHSPDDGRSFMALRPPTNLSSKRIAVAYAEDGGADKDGLIEIRPGAKDLSLGGSKYAQVRIAVDGTHYIKGVAIYNPDLPEGVDLRFNTNKNKSADKHAALKKIESDDPLNPFGASIKPGGQRGHLNIVNEEGDWSGWSRNLSSQFLSKQTPTLAKTQLELTHSKRKAELDEILALTNPAVRKKLLESFADGADSASVHLKAAALPRTSNHVIIPVTSLKANEVYAPNFRDGERVALVRHPHGGRSEIPELTVNNRSAQARKLLGTTPKDAIGINPKVAERLSGADFDGDTVLVIPNNQGKVKSAPALPGLKGFDPRSAYPEYPGMRRMSERTKQLEMGVVSNLITDMTIRGANNQELARAIKHSMVVIDAEKHNLDYRSSAKDNGIAQLKEKYQGPRGKGGAKTLISRASAEVRVNERKPRPAQDGGPIDKATGKKVFVETGNTYVNAKGQTVRRTQSSKRLAETDDAFTLVDSPRTPMETVYAEHSNRLKSLANQARKEMVNTKTTPYSRSAKQVYNKEVASLNAKLNLALKNAPLERQAQVLANAVVSAKRQANPNMDSSTLKKVQKQALDEARIRTGAGKQRIVVTQKEWDAIQAGAISNHRLEGILNNSDLDTIRQLATPRVNTVMTSSKQSQAKAMLNAGYTPAEVAQRLGVAVSTLRSSIEGG